MAVTNNNKPMLDRPIWEQLSFAPAMGIAGTCTADDDERYIYTLFQTSATASQFWRYDTWWDTWQQLATPATQTGTVNTLVFAKEIGTQFSGRVYGSVYLFNGNGTTAYFYKYDIATNVWSANLGTTNVPATFATDAYICLPCPRKNAYSTAYHSGVTRTITTGAAAAVGATSITVAALPEALAANTVLRFGSYQITITSAVAKGDTTIAVSGATESMAVGTVLRCTNGQDIVVSSAFTGGGSTLTVYPVMRALSTSVKINVEKFAVLTASAAAAATSVTVSALLIGIPNASTAPYYGNMYLAGNNATVVYRYNIGTNAWATTSANSGNPAIPAVTGAIGAGCAVKWLPSVTPDKLWFIRGGATANVYMYDLVANTFSTETFYPSTETFTTGTNYAARSVNGKQHSLIIQKDSTGRLYEGRPELNTLEPKGTQWLYPIGTAVVGDKSCVITSPDGIDFYYTLINSSTGFVRCAMIDS